MYVCVCLFDVNFPEDDVKEVETCRSISGLYVRVYIVILVRLLALSIKLPSCVFLYM